MDMTFRSCRGLAFAVSQPHASPPAQPTAPPPTLGCPRLGPDPRSYFGVGAILSFVKYSALPLIHPEKSQSPFEATASIPSLSRRPQVSRTDSGTAPRLLSVSMQRGSQPDVGQTLSVLDLDQHFLQSELV